MTRVLWYCVDSWWPLSMEVGIGPCHIGWRRGVAVTLLGISTKLLYVGPG